jgi:hypothetical protein
MLCVACCFVHAAHCTLQEAGVWQAAEIVLEIHRLTLHCTSRASIVMSQALSAAAAAVTTALEQALLDNGADDAAGPSTVLRNSLLLQYREIGVLLHASSLLSTQVRPRVPSVRRPSVRCMQLAC